MTSAVRTGHVQNTPGWIEARRDVIGSSDVAVLTGNTPYASSLLDLFAYKTRLLEAEPPDQATQELFDLGHALEDVIAARYRVHPRGRPVRRSRQLLIHPEHTWAAASLDRVSAVAGERRVIEVKWVPFRRWDGPEDVPSYVQDQVQWQLFVTGWAVADVAVLSGAHVEVYEVERDDAYIADLVAIARWFLGHMMRGEPPPLDGSERTARTLRRLRPFDDGTMLEPTTELLALMGAWRRAKGRLAVATDDLGKIKNAIRFLLEEHAGSRGPDWTLSYRRSRDSSRTEWEYVARAYREVIEQMRAGVTRADDLDALVSLHSETREGIRSLRAWWRGEPAEETDTPWT